MTTTAPAPDRTAERRPVGRLRSLGSLARAELTLVARSRMQMFNAIVMPIGVVFLLLPIAREGAAPSMIARALGTLVVMVLLFVVYYNLLSAYVARRQELVLRRLRTGECSDAVILAGTAVPAFAFAFGQTLLIVVLSRVVLDVPWPSHPGILVAGALVGAVTLAVLALLTTTITGSVESTQVTSLPVIALVVLSAGLAVPLEVLPDRVEVVARLLPGAPVADLTRLGWLGTDAVGAVLSTTDAWTAAAPRFALLAAWTVVGAIVVSRTFRWSPR